MKTLLNHSSVANWTGICFILKKHFKQIQLIKISWVMAKVMDSSLSVNEFEHPLHYYVHFRINILGKSMNIQMSPATSQKVTSMFCHNDGFDIK